MRNLKAFKKVKVQIQCQKQFSEEKKHFGVIDDVATADLNLAKAIEG